MSNTENKVDLDKLEEYIGRLEKLYNRFPENKCQGAIYNERLAGTFEGGLNGALDEIESMHENLKSLISKTYKYLTNFKNSVETNDEINASTISSGNVDYVKICATVDNIVKN